MIRNLEVLFAGKGGRGPVLILDAAISFWGGVDPQTGTIVDVRHPQHGQSICGTLLFLPGTIGSSSASSVLLELVRCGRAPAALLMDAPDAILLLGLIVGREMDWSPPMAARMRKDEFAAWRGRHAELREEGVLRPIS